MMKNYVLVTILAFFCVSLFGQHTNETVTIKVSANSSDQKNPIYMQIMDSTSDREFVQSDDGKFKINLDLDKTYILYVGQKGHQTYKFNVNTFIDEMLTGDFSFAIDVKLTPRIGDSKEKREHDIEIIPNAQNKPVLSFKKRLH